MNCWNSSTDVIYLDLKHPIKMLFQEYRKFHMKLIDPSPHNNGVQLLVRQQWHKTICTCRLWKTFFLLCITHLCTSLQICPVDCPLVFAHVTLCKCPCSCSFSTCLYTVSSSSGESVYSRIDKQSLMHSQNASDVETIPYQSTKLYCFTASLSLAGAPFSHPFPSHCSFLVMHQYKKSNWTRLN